MNKSAGQRLREDLDKALAHAGRESGRVLEFSEPELQLIDWAAEDADRAAELRQLYDAELAGDRHPTILVKLSAEIPGVSSCRSRAGGSCRDRPRQGEEPPACRRRSGPLARTGELLMAREAARPTPPAGELDDHEDDLEYQRGPAGQREANRIGRRRGLGVTGPSGIGTTCGSKISPSPTRCQRDLTHSSCIKPLPGH